MFSEFIYFMNDKVDHTLQSNINLNLYFALILLNKVRLNNDNYDSD